ncbi:uncharacterized protein LOC116295251 [Actinia tenebrosa]|uniref:Uncharacterized protein LOC116295251 n=1 Tax=Actinia tenebrosa TaxID=6105 RepID=A0A6P8HR91_ACTTE|nr:uncharacterized protein LOC116295251 [Actinia tenebrosa]
MEVKMAPTKMWTNYSLHNARKWLGRWTRWNPVTREVNESFKSIRHIELVEDMTKMKHQNTFIYDDDREPLTEGPMNGPWEYQRDRDCDEEGLCHPSTRLNSKKARAFFLENGGGAWTVMEPTLGDVFFQENFFPNNDIRFSTGMLYGKDGKALRLTAIREDSRCRPSLYWSEDNQIKDSFSAPVQGTFIGTEQILTANLRQTVREGCEWDKEYWLQETRLLQDGNTLFYLPDNVALSCPLQLYEDSTNRQFHISTFCLYDVNKDNPEIRVQTVFYEKGRFSCFKQGIYRKASQ